MKKIIISNTLSPFRANVKGLFLTFLAVSFSLAVQAQDFVTTWRTTSANESITIPTASGTYDYTIDWGDGSAVENNVSGDATHMYTTAGIKTITISGTFPRIQLGSLNPDGDVVPTTAAGQIRSVEQWGDIVWASMELAFAGCDSLTIPESGTRLGTSNPDLSRVTSMAYMFAGKPLDPVDPVRSVVLGVGSNRQRPDLRSWDVSNVTDMQFMFLNSTFNGRIIRWDVSNVTNMKSMFQGSAFSSGTTNWNVSNVTDMSSMFEGAFRFNQNITTWNVSSVTDMSRMFVGSSFNQNISGWNVSNVEDMSGMFFASPFNQDISGWNVSNVKNMSGMFASSPFNQDINRWNVSSVTDMSFMFVGTFDFDGMLVTSSAFDQDIGNWDISSVTAMVGMFDGSSMSPTNYDALLNGWSTLETDETSIPEDILFVAPPRYTCTGAPGRTILIDTYNWSFIGDSGSDITIMPKNAGAVTEEGDLVFTIKATPAPCSDLTINYIVTDVPDADFVDAANQGSQMVTLPQGMTTVDITVSTESDDTDEPNGSVVVTVDSGADYIPGSTNNSDSINVNDDDATTSTLTGTMTDITEGGTKEFTVSIGRALRAGESLEIPLSFAGTATRGTDYTTTGPDSPPEGVTFTELNDVTDGNNPRVIFNGDDGAATTVTLTLTAAADTDAESGGETVIINPGTPTASGLGGDAAATTDNFEEFSINDPAQVSLLFTGSIGEDESKSLTVSRSEANNSGNTLFIPIQVKSTGTTAQEADYTVPASIGIPNGAFIGSADIRATDNSIDEPNKKIIIELGPLPAGNLPSSGFSEVMIDIVDNDSTTVTLTTPDTETTEGSTTDQATLRLTLGRALQTGETLDVPLSFNGGTLNTDFTLSFTNTETVELSGSTVTFTGDADGSDTMADVLLSAPEDDDSDDETVTVSIPPNSAFDITPKLTSVGLGGRAKGIRTGNGEITLKDNDNSAPTGKPTITGTETQGQTLTANRGNIMDADGLGTFSYQWKRGGDDISGETDETYMLVQADVGETITVTVSYTDGGGTAESVESDATAAIANVNDEPTGKPTITGTPTQGETLTANRGNIMDADGLGTFSYQWKRSGTNISGAISSTYTLAQADVGETITVTVSYTDGGGTAESVESDATAAVANVSNDPTGKPMITGTTAQGETLTAETDDIMDADGLGSFSYQWKRGGANISGATASTYALVQADVGEMITVTVSYTDGDGTAESVDSDATAAVANVNDAPTGKPTITGMLTQGETLTANRGNIMDDDGLGTFSYQWKRSGANISGATSSTYMLAQADVGETITVTVSYTDGGSTAESVESDATAAIANVNDEPTGKPTITGMETQGQTLTANRGSIMDADGVGDTFSYQWKRGGTNIPLATSSTYMLMQADVGETITVTVSYTDGEGTAESVESDATAAVANVNDDPTGKPTITGTPTKGQELTANRGNIMDADGVGDTFSYQWKRSGANISGATASTYTLVQADVGETITVTVSYTDGGSTAESVESEATAAVTNFNNEPTGKPTITGTETQGETLTANRGNIMDTDGVGSFSYQWKRSGANISGATASTYTLVQADVGETITVTVSYTDGGGTAESVDSDATAAIANVNDDPTGKPTITGTPTQGETLTANASSIMDADGVGDTFSYQWRRGGTNIPLATSSTYTLVQADVGETITVTVSYTDGGSTAESVESDATAAVANVNDEPTLENAIPNQTAMVSMAFSFQFAANTFSDADSDDLSYSAALSDDSDLPDWLTFAEATRTFSGTPQAGDASTISIKVTADDGNGGSVSDVFNLVVSPAAPTNSAPTVANEIPDGTATVGVAYNYQFPADAFSDADNDPLEYSAALSNDSALPTWLTFAKATRTFSGTPEAGDDGTIMIKVTADDGNGGSVSDVFNLVVSPAAPTNSAPTVANEIPDGTATVGTVYSYQFPDDTFSDADNDPLEYSATLSDDSVLPTWLTFAKATRTFSGTPEAGDDGTIMIKVTADDGNGGSVSDVFDLVVSPAAPSNSAPTLENAIPNQTAMVSMAFSFQFAANTFSDADSDDLSYSAALSDDSALPTWLDFDDATRTFSGTPQANIMRSITSAIKQTSCIKIKEYTVT